MPAVIDSAPTHPALTFTHRASTHSVGRAELRLGDAMAAYSEWPAPTVIVADGPYGVKGFPGDPPSVHGLPEWYRPHIQAWWAKATPETTLWFWGTEVGWASVHQVLNEVGWEYVGCNVWDKGIAHVAGNCNTKTLRKFPVVTEVCVQYVKPARFVVNGRNTSMKEWLRWEWQRSGLPLHLTNDACGVRNAATRKYFTQCHLWYFPPVEAMERLVTYANRDGVPAGRPYFSLDGEQPVTSQQWGRMRSKFQLQMGVTNVWNEPQLRGEERIRVDASLGHPNQKPVKLIRRILEASSDPGDVVWEPFGGLCTVAVASLQLSRRSYSAEVLPGYFGLAARRLDAEARPLHLV